MKPLMGQVQNQAHLDDLLGSPKVKAGNFSLPEQKTSQSTSKKDDTAPSFADMLLSTINKSTPSESKKQEVRLSNNGKLSAKIPDEQPRIERPTPKPAPAKTPANARDNGSAFKEIGTREATHNAQASSERSFGPAGVNQSEDVPTQKSFESSVSEAKTALAPLKKQVNGKAGSEGILNGNAVLAFVSGRLDKLDPETLPSIVSDSLLIKQALASGDIAEFMQTPMTIADLAAMMELDQGILNKAAMNGLDPSKIVSPKDFINALGIDAGRVTAELTMLQQKLPIEGIKGYIDRAKALAANGGVAQNTMESLAPKKQNPDSSDSMPGIAPATALPDSISSAIEIPIPMELSGQMAAGHMPAMNTQPAGNQSAKNNVLNSTNQSAIPQVNRSKPAMTEDPAEMLMRQSRISGQSIINANIPVMPGMSNTPAMPQPGQISTSNEDLKNQITPSNSSIQTESADLPFANYDQFNLTMTNQDITDPFSEAGKLMDNQSKLAIDFGGDGINHRSIQEHLLAQGLDASSFARETKIESDSKTFDPAQISSGLDSSQLTDLKLSNQINNMSENQNSPSQNAMNLGDTKFSDGGNGGQDSSQDFAGQFSDQAGDMVAAMGKGATTTREASSIFAEKIAQAPKSNMTGNIASKILGHAQMMLKSGGGSMSVNVEAPGIGKIDVAINLINNQLDVRIITASEQARDMISKEITGLRDGLTQQGINLRGFEVGKAGESSTRNFAGQGQQQFGQGAQDQRATYNDMKEYVQSFRNTYIPRVNSTSSLEMAAPTRWMNKANALMSDRRLEVRV